MQLPNRLGKMLSPLHWHDYKKKYGKLDDFVASHPEVCFISGYSSSWILYTLLSYKSCEIRNFSILKSRETSLDSEKVHRR